MRRDKAGAEKRGNPGFRLGGDLVTMKTIDDFAVAGLRVLVRADLNVPLAGLAVLDEP